MLLSRWSIRVSIIDTANLKSFDKLANISTSSEAGMSEEGYTV